MIQAKKQEIDGDGNLLHDFERLFHMNSVLHETEALNWLSDLEELKYTVSKEHELGLGELPTVYTSYFLSLLAFIL